MRVRRPASTSSVTLQRTRARWVIFTADRRRWTVDFDAVLEATVDGDIAIGTIDGFMIYEGDKLVMAGGSLPTGTNWEVVLDAVAFDDQMITVGDWTWTCPRLAILPIQHALDDRRGYCGNARRWHGQRRMERPVPWHAGR